MFPPSMFPLGMFPAAMFPPGVAAITFITQGEVAIFPPELVVDVFDREIATQKFAAEDT